MPKKLFATKEKTRYLRKKSGRSARGKRKDVAKTKRFKKFLLNRIIFDARKKREESGDPTGSKYKNKSNTDDAGNLESRAVALATGQGKRK